MLKQFLTMIFFGMALGVPVAAQDLNVEVAVDRSQINSTSLDFVDALQRQIDSYLNEFDWTEVDLMDHERIAADMQIILTGFDNYTFRGIVVVRSMRPIFNTTRQTTLFLTRDDSWTFNYTPNRSLLHDELAFDSIASLLDYYAFIILGYDFDSFSEMGGSDYFTRAQNVVSVAQTASTDGWTRSGGARRNRAQLVADLLNPGYNALRRAVYRYHRLGLDLFTSNPVEARSQILEALEMIREAKRLTTNTLIFDIFFNAKYMELVSVFEDASLQVRDEAYGILSEVDRSHLSEYERIRN